MFTLLRQHPAIAVTAAVIAALLIWGFWPQPVLVETQQARRAPMAVTIEEEGRTRVIDRYVVSAPVDGVACRVQLDMHRLGHRYPQTVAGNGVKLNARSTASSIRPWRTSRQRS